MKIREIKENKKQFLPLLLLADEQEDIRHSCLHMGDKVTAISTKKDAFERLFSFDTPPTAIKMSVVK